MRIITISRELGSGGRELGKRLAHQLGFDYYDREIITEIAKRRGLNSEYVEDTLNSSAWQIPITFGRSFGMATQVLTTHTELLIEQTKVIEDMVALGRDCIFVGRNADIILKDLNPFRIFVCADIEARIDRCERRAESGENLTRKEIKNHIMRIDRMRANSRGLIADSEWGSKEAYHLIVNTTDWDIKSLVPAVAEFAIKWFNRPQ